MQIQSTNERAKTAYPDLVREMDPARKKFLYVRGQAFEKDASDPELEAYLANSYAGVEFFADLFLSGNVSSFRVFIEALRRHHLLVVGNSYHGYFEGELSKDSHLPGVFLHELDPEYAANRAVVPIEREHIDKMLLALDPDSDAIEILTDQATSEEKRIKIRIDGIPPNSPSLPTLRKYIHKWLRESPEFKYHRRYLKKLHKLFLEIQANLHDPDSLVPLIGRYYHLGINIHPFVRVNNSWLMPQVNLMLMSAGIEGTAHMNWDYLAMVTSSTEFTRVFSQRILFRRGAERLH